MAMTEDKCFQTKRLILEWSHQILQGKSSASFYPLFTQKISIIYGLRLCFDESMSNLLLQLLNSVKFQSFSEQLKQDQRQNLFEIANILYVEDYIGKRQYLCIMNQKKVYMVSRIELFLNICQEGQPSIEEVQELWSTIIDIPFEDFWKNSKKMKSLPSIFERIYDKVKGMKGTEDFVAFFCKGNNQLLKKQKQQKQVKKDFQQIEIKQKRYKLIEKVQLISKKQPSTSEEEDSPRRKAIYLNEGIKQKTFDYLIQNSEKYRRFYEYVQSVKANDSRASNYLLKLVYKQALFFNKQYSSIISSIHTFLNTLIKALKSSKISYFELFGSIRNNLALIEQFDIDISSIPRIEIDATDLEVKKKQESSLLFYLRNKLKANQYPWLTEPFVYNFKNIKVPFLKLTLNSEEMNIQFCFSLNKVDITIGNQSGAKNSQLISKFMSQPSIAAFCLLIKLWAKRTNIINSNAPMKGLSSYGIALMSLYYLMESKQINFIQLDQGFNVVTDVINPNLNNCKLKSLSDNFCGFLQFYRETGRFQKQQQTICLLKNFKDHCNFQFNHQILFNMWDFIDKTNPGRYRFENKKPIYSKFETSIRAIKQDIDTLKDLFGDKS